MADPRDDDKPQYTLYRSRPKLFRRRSDDGGLGEPAPAGLQDAPPDAPRRRRRWRPGRRIGVWRVVRWLLVALVGWLFVSLILFLVSAQIEAVEGLQRRGRRARQGRVHAHLAQHGAGARLRRAAPTARRRGRRRSARAARARTRSCSCGSAAGTTPRCRSPATRSSTSPATARTRSTRPTPSAARRWPSAPSPSTSGIPINHLVEVNFDNFPQLIDALGGITYKGSCVVSKINGGFKNGGYTLHLKGGTHEINGKQALALARTRHNECNPKESDLTRQRRQQKILGAIKGKVTSFETFFRLPWVSWAAPKAVRSDMRGPSLLGLVGAELSGGTAKPTVLKPSGDVTLPDGGAGLTVTDATKRAAVEKFLQG